MSIERAAKEYLNDFIFDHSDGKVLSGPFKGMQLLKEVSWSDGNLANKVLGCYEQELHEVIEHQIDRLAKLDRPPIILDIGCSEGYYAVGMALRLPDAKVSAIDTSEDALRITRAAAKANKVSINTGLLLFDENFNTGYQPDLVICDCEGYETDYLDLNRFPGLKTATIIVECHDAIGRPVTNTLGPHFSESHEVWLVTEGGRDPNQYEVLKPMSSLMRWLAVCEGRPCMMHWLFLNPKKVDEPVSQAQQTVSAK